MLCLTRTHVRFICTQVHMKIVKVFITNMLLDDPRFQTNRKPCKNGSLLKTNKVMAKHAVHCKATLPPFEYYQHCGLIHQDVRIRVNLRVRL